MRQKLTGTEKIMDVWMFLEGCLSPEKNKKQKQKTKKQKKKKKKKIDGHIKSQNDTSVSIQRRTRYIAGYHTLGSSPRE